MSNVCQNIPGSILPEDYKHIGYHRECHKRFTSHVPQSKKTAEMANKRPVRTPSSSILFPLESIFCGKFETKDDGKTYRSKHLAVQRKMDGTLTESWRSIEQKAKDMGKYELYRKINGQNLFARKASHHEASFNKCDLEYLNGRRKQSTKIGMNPMIPKT